MISFTLKYPRVVGKSGTQILEHPGRRETYVFIGRLRDFRGLELQICLNISLVCCNFFFTFFRREFHVSVGNLSRKNDGRDPDVSSRLPPCKNIPLFPFIALPTRRIARFIAPISCFRLINNGTVLSKTNVKYLIIDTTRLTRRSLSRTST